MLISFIFKLPSVTSVRVYWLIIMIHHLHDFWAMNDNVDWNFANGNNPFASEPAFPNHAGPSNRTGIFYCPAIRKRKIQGETNSSLRWVCHQTLFIALLQDPDIVKTFPSVLFVFYGDIAMSLSRGGFGIASQWHPLLLHHLRKAEEW